MAIITIEDVSDAVKAAFGDDLQTVVDGLNAKALRVAPCLADTEDEAAIAEARLVLWGTLKRWAEAGAGAFSQQTAGPFSVSTDTRQRTGYALWPSEVTALQDVCATGGSSSKAFEVDTSPDVPYRYRWTAPDAWEPLS